MLELQFGLMGENKVGCVFPWSFGPNSAWDSIETTIERMQPTLSAKQICYNRGESWGTCKARQQKLGTYSPRYPIVTYRHGNSTFDPLVVDQNYQNTQSNISKIDSDQDGSFSKLIKIRKT